MSISSELQLCSKHGQSKGLELGGVLGRGECLLLKVVVRAPCFGVAGDYSVVVCGNGWQEPIMNT